MCKAFAQIGVEVTLAIPKNDCAIENNEIIRQELGTPANFKIIEYRKFTIYGRPSTLGAYWGVKSILKDHPKYDFCYTRNFFLANLSSKMGLKTIYEEHDKKLHPHTLLNKYYTKKMLSNIHSDKIIKMIVISNALADVWIKQGVPSEKIMSAHDGVSLDEYKNIKDQSQARKELGIKKQKKIIMYVGSLYRDRGIETIIKLAGRFPNECFMVIGGPENEKNYYQADAASKNLKNMIFTGRIPHYKVKDYLFASDVLLMLWTSRTPTIDICSPLKLFEYMAAEKIIVGYGFPTIKEVCSDGIDSFLATPCSYDELENKLKQAISLEYPNQLAINARRLIIKKYNWQYRAQQILNSFTL